MQCGRCTLRRAIRLRALLATVSVSAVQCANAAHAGSAVPTGGRYVAGAGAIGGNAGSLTVTQSSTTGIVDWNSFSIGKGHSVTFDNGNGATLNEVTGGALSTIAGSLHASGSVFLINQAGIIVSGTGRIVTGGSFVASTQSPDGKPRGDIIDAGSIRSEHGTARLSAANVRVTGSVAVERGGELWLTSSGTTSIAGALDADNARGVGGTVVATGKTVDVAGTADISASGTSKGGTILIGGDLHGGTIAADDFVKANVATAQITNVDKGAKLSANASLGAGGNIVIWSDGRTSFDGGLGASGETTGGFAEVSSHDWLTFDGIADLTSASGKTGTLLLDPENVTISTAATSNGTLSGDIFTPTGNNSILNVTTLENALATANVTVTTGGSGSLGDQSGNIAIASPLSWSSTHTLTLDAYQSIAVDALVAIKGAGGLVLKTDNGGSDGTLSFSSGRIAYTDVVSGTTQGSLTIEGVSYTLVNSIKQLAADVAANASGNYALANSYNASADGTYTSAPVATTFNGNFEGLGNEIGNLTIDDQISATDMEDVGLFATLGSSGTISNVALVNAAVTAEVPATQFTELHGFEGALIGVSDGTVMNSWATGSVTANNDIIDEGGLIGVQNAGTTEGSHAAVAVVGENLNSSVYTTDAGWLGGLIGALNAGTITGSYAAGSITATANSYPYAYNGAGGLVGASAGTITNSHAVADIVTNDAGQENIGGDGGQKDIGGLVGDASGGSITDSYAGGTITDDSSPQSHFGGLVGVQYGATISASYATASIATSGDNTIVGGLVGISDGAISASYASGSVTDTGQAAIVGGFAGVSYLAISASHATGAVTDNVAEAPDAGGFVGEQVGGAITGSYATGAVSAQTGGAEAGGFAGASYGTLDDDHATGAVTVADGGAVGGGFVGLEYEGAIENSYASGAVGASSSATAIGGFVGEENGGTIASAHAGGNATGAGQTATGGFAGSQQGGTIGVSYATGNATAGTNAAVGGFAGVQAAGAIAQSYATGAAASAGGQAAANVGGFIGVAQGTISESYSSGNATGGNASGSQPFIGGFVGLLNGGTITNSYSNGSANAGTNSWVGGFVGTIYSGTISDSYSTGSAGGAGFAPGGFAGSGSAPEFSDDYWDTTTSGITNLAQGAGNTANVAGIAGLSTAQFQSGLPPGFSSAVWGENASVDGGLPYLLDVPRAH